MTHTEHDLEDGIVCAFYKMIRNYLTIIVFFLHNYG
jgi:hypothetical protein